MYLFQHIILTRFNVFTSDWKSKKRLDIGWLDSRLELFKLYCYSSLKNQTNLNFSWLVFFDIDTPIMIKRKILELERNWSNFIPIYVDNYEKQHKNSIKKIIKNEVKYIITSRIDNDDAFAINYVQSVQDLFIENVKKYSSFIINFNKGYVLDLKAQKVYIRNHYINAFCSLIEPIEHFKTVWVRDHRELGKLYKIMKINSEPMWLQVVHDSNLSNKVRTDSYLTNTEKVTQYIKIEYQINTRLEPNLIFFFYKIQTRILYSLTIIFRPVKRTLENIIRLIIFKEKKF